MPPHQRHRRLCVIDGEPTKKTCSLLRLYVVEFHPFFYSYFVMKLLEDDLLRERGKEEVGRRSAWKRKREMEKNGLCFFNATLTVLTAINLQTQQEKRVLTLRTGVNRP